MLVPSLVPTVPVAGLRRSFAALLLSGLVAVLPTLALAGPLAFDGVEISGNRRIDADSVRSQLSVKGKEASPEQINEDIKAIFRTGFFDDVQAAVVRSDKGRTVLRFSVVEKPLVRKTFIRGNKEVSESELQEVIKVEGRRFLDQTKVKGVIRDAVMYYQGQGFYDVAITFEVLPVGDNQVDLTFVVTEGQRYRIREIMLDGLQEVDPDDVRAVMETKHYKWWNSWLLGTGRLNSLMLENDRGLMRQYFLDHGYIDATISEPAIEKVDGGLIVRLQVHEGPRYQISQIEVQGDLVEGDAAKTLDGISSKVGEIFNAGQVREDVFRVSEKFTDRGYAFANVVPDTRLNREEHTVALQFQVAQGKPVVVDRILIRGNDKTYDSVIRRELRFAEQEPYSSSKVKRSRELLQRLGYFEEVNLATEPTAVEDRVNVVATVREGSTGTFSAGAGYSTSDGIIFNARLSENNIFGTGRRAHVDVDWGSERENAVVSFSDRRVNDTFLSAGVEGFRTDREFDDFDRFVAGGSGSLGYPLEELLGESFEDVNAGLQYEFSAIDIQNVDADAAQLVRDQAGKSTASAIIPSLTRNTINNPLNPTRGSNQSLSVELAGLGGDQRYYLVEARNTWYYPLFSSETGGLVMSLRTRLGYGETFNDDDFPLFKRYFPGGINSVRGFDNRSLGPKDERGSEYGGSKQIVNNLEFIFPLATSAGIKGVVFYDLGQAFDDGKGITFGDLRHAYGAGIRWMSPLGPIRIEFGFPIDKEEGEGSMVTHFSFGAPL